MLSIILIGLIIGIVYADVAPPAHQPKLDIPGASSRGTSFTANEFYAAAGVKSTYPLPDCFTNESGFMCCNADLLDEMHKAYDELRASRGSDWISCNIQAIANRVQKRAEKRFGLQFEVLAGIADFASKARFYHNYICKLEREGRIILAYATPKTPAEIATLAKSGIPGVAGKPELPSTDSGKGEAGGAGGAVGGAGGAAGGAGGAAGGAGETGGVNGARETIGGAGSVAGSFGGAGGAGAGVHGAVGGAGGAGAGAHGGAGASAGVGGFGSSAAGGAGARGAAGSAAGAYGSANAGQGVKLTAPYRRTRADTRR